MAIGALPPAQHAKWMTLLERACSSMLQLEVINAAIQWYGGPISIGVATSVVAALARAARVDWWNIVLGAATYAVAKSAMSGSLDSPTLFSVFFAVVCAAGGAAIADRIVPVRIDAAAVPVTSQA
jgi:hypothetical protein